MSKKINFYAPVHFEPWDYRNPDDPGIGGSETQVVEMSWRLARRGYDVTVYAPIPDDCEPLWRSTAWLHYEHVDPSEEAIWILSRCPWAVAEHDFNGEVWVVMQDEDCVGVSPIHPWKPALVEKMDRILPLNPAHMKHLYTKHRLPAEKLFLSTNGVRVDLFEEIEANGAPERNLKAGIYASSPDRGMVQALLPHWNRVRELVGDAELDIYYGFDNIEKWMANQHGGVTRDAERMLRRFERYKDQPGVHWHGRIGQRDLYREWLSHGVWPYWTSFKETSCIACMEAQAGGALPITRPLWALAFNVEYGAMVDGDPWEDSRSLAAMVNYTARFINQGEDLADYRRRMMLNARWRFDWERVVDQYQCWIEGFDLMGVHPEGYSELPLPWCVFQRAEARGETLVVGAGGDSPGFRSMEPKATLVDVAPVDPVTEMANNIDDIMDGRDLRFPDNSFDTVVLGEVIEHCSDGAAWQVVREAMRVARERVVVTVPEDERSVEEQIAWSKEEVPSYDYEIHDYEGGFSVHHINLWTYKKLVKFFGEPIIYRPLRQVAGRGHGMVFDASSPDGAR